MEQNMTGAEVAETLRDKSYRLGELVYRFAQVDTDAPEAKLLWQVIAAQRRIIDREIKERPGNLRDFEDVIVNWVVAVHLTAMHVTRIYATEARGEAFTESDRAVTHALSEALDDLEVAAQALSLQLPVPDLSTTLASKIWFAFWEMRACDAAQIAANSIAIVDNLRLLRLEAVCGH